MEEHTTLKRNQIAPPVLGRQAGHAGVLPIEYRGISSARVENEKEATSRGVLWRAAAKVLHKPGQKCGGSWDLSRLPNCCILVGPGEEEVGYAGVQPAEQ